MQTTYHNTTNLTGEELKRKVQSATSCKAAVLTLFQHQRGKAFTASKVHLLLTKAGHKWSLNGVRGRTTDLMKDGDLVMTGDKEPGVGQYKELECLYTLNLRKHPTQTDAKQQTFF